MLIEERSVIGKLLRAFSGKREVACEVHRTPKDAVEVRGTAKASQAMNSDFLHGTIGICERRTVAWQAMSLVSDSLKHAHATSVAGYRLSLGVLLKYVGKQDQVTSQLIGLRSQEPS